MCENENSLPVERTTNINYSSGYNFKLEQLPRPLAVYSKMEQTFPLKYPNPEKEIISIIGIQTIDVCRIYSQGGKPVFISEIASLHYGVSNLNELVGKPVSIFRRFRNKENNHETPWRWHTYKATINSFANLGRLDMATATTEDKNGLIELIVIHRICIDWDYKKLN